MVQITDQRKAIIWLAAAAITAMSIYPPWVHIAQWHERRYAYGWIFNPPQGPTHTVEIANPFLQDLVGKNTEPEPGWRTELDFERLLIQCAMVGVLGATLFFACTSIRRPSIGTTKKQVQMVRAVVAAVIGVGVRILVVLGFAFRIYTDITHGDWGKWLVSALLMAGLFFVLDLKERWQSRYRK